MKLLEGALAFKDIRLAVAIVELELCITMGIPREIRDDFIVSAGPSDRRPPLRLFTDEEFSGPNVTLRLLIVVLADPIHQ